MAVFDFAARCARAAIVAFVVFGAVSPAAGQEDRQPRVLEVMPGSGTESIAENQIFVLKLSRPLEKAPAAECNVEGIRSGIPVEVLKDKSRQAALAAAGVPDAPVWLALRCKTRFPDAARVSLSWHKPERLPDGERDPSDYWYGQYFHFTARTDRPFNLTCSRENEGAGCNPLMPVSLRFAVSLDENQARQIYLRDARGKIHRSLPERETGYQEDNVLSFGRLPAGAVFTVHLPPALTDYKGKPLGSGDRKLPPFRFKMADFPPLVKFAADFGVIERLADPVLPLTVRNVEPVPALPADGSKTAADSSPAGQAESAPTPAATQKAGTAAKVRYLRLRDDAKIIAALGELQGWQAGDNYRAWSEWGDDEGGVAPKAVPKGGDSRAYSMLRGRKGAVTRELPKPNGAKPMEVVGLPLPEPGFYLVEAESRKLGRSLLGANRSMFVRTGALVTNLGAHLHHSEELAMVWVTTLNQAKPVAGAKVELRDCKGKPLGEAVTDGQGVALISGPLPQQDYRCPLFAFARKGDDFSFVRSDWMRGIESWRFNLGYEWQARKHLGHTALARNLLRPGEVVHMKHYARLAVPAGIAYPKAEDLPKTAEIAHEGGQDRYSVPLAWDGRGNAETSWTLPAGAKRGLYTVALGRFGSSASFRVEDFRLPLLKAEVTIPKSPLISPDKVGVDLRLSYLSGGGAGGEKVKVRHRFTQARVVFPQYPEHFFGEETNRWSRWVADEEGGGETESGEADEPDAKEGENTTLRNPGADHAIVLNQDGAARVTVSFAKPVVKPTTLIADMEYRDPNGETYTAQSRATVWPAAQVLGIKTDYWAAVKDRASAEFLVLDVNGKPVADAPVAATATLRAWLTHRKRTVGGFYTYHHEEKTSELGKVCEGKTDRAGRFTCAFPVSASGEVRLRGESADANGRQAHASASFWVYSGEEIWFRAEDHDRIDVLPEKKRYEPNEIARLQIRSPFREATALVAVQRSGGVLDYYVRRVSGKQPTIELPVKPEYAPNVYVSVFLVRGRVAAPAPTALVDLARPSFKLGIAQIEVGARKHEMKVSLKADKAVYQTREKAKVKVVVEGAANAAGTRPLPAEREVAVFAVDEALLELLPNDTWNALSTMLAKRTFGFQTATAQMQVVGKRHYGRKALPPGGGGGRQAARELFDTLLMWQGKAKLDGNGEATVEVPLNDSLTRFRIVALADGGPDQFGVGWTSIAATRELQVLSGLPAVVRDGDSFAGRFTVRNAGERPMHVKANGTAGTQPLAEQSLELAPGEAKGVAWRVAAPASGALEWNVRVSETQGRSDAIRVKQAVEPALSTVRFQSAGFELKGARNLNVAPPPGAVPGRGELLVAIAPKLGTDAASVREYMRSYPFFCLEQRTSKAVSLRDKGLWAIIASGIDGYVSENGLVNYYPTEGGEGYDVLTSFVLSASHEAGWELPEGARRKMLDGLAAFVDGRLENRHGYYRNDEFELTERKILALDALSRFGRARPEMADSLRLEPARLSTRALIEWAGVLHRTQWPRRDERLKAALAELKQRYTLTPSGLSFRNEPGEDRWWLMYSSEVTAVKLLLLALDLPQLAPELENFARGAVARQRHGHWMSTQANVWGSLALDKYGQRVAQNGLSGKTVVRYGAQSLELDWAHTPGGESFKLPLVVGVDRLSVDHRGNGAPYVQVVGLAYAPLKEAVGGHIAVTRTVTPLKQAGKGVWTVGDIARISIRFKLDQASGWLVVSDPLPAGATALGGALKGLAGKTSAPQRSRWWRDGSPMFVERTFSFYRAYYEYLEAGEYTLEYDVRLNNSGRFNLPPTHVEAMYSPEVYADAPNPPLEVK